LGQAQAATTGNACPNLSPAAREALTLCLRRGRKGTSRDRAGLTDEGVFLAVVGAFMVVALAIAMVSGLTGWGRAGDTHRRDAESAEAIPSSFTPHAQGPGGLSRVGAAFHDTTQGASSGALSTPGAGGHRSLTPGASSPAPSAPRSAPENSP